MRSENSVTAHQDTVKHKNEESRYLLLRHVMMRFWVLSVGVV